MSSFPHMPVKKAKRKLQDQSKDYTSAFNSTNETVPSSESNPIPKKRKSQQLKANNKLPKTSRSKKPRLPKKRTKTGCFSCRKRKKKCDERSPVCSGCARNFLQCVWPDHDTETLPVEFSLKSTTKVSHSPAIPSSTFSNSNSDPQMQSTLTAPTTTGFSGNGMDSRSSLLNQTQTENQDQDMATVAFTINTEKELLFPIEISPNDPIEPDYGIPSKMCSVISLNSYHHDYPEGYSECDCNSAQCSSPSCVSTPGNSPPGLHSNSALAVTGLTGAGGVIPTVSRLTVMPVMCSTGSSSTLNINLNVGSPSSTHLQAIETQSVNQMFDSLYSTLKTDSLGLPWSGIRDVPLSTPTTSRGGQLTSTMSYSSEDDCSSSAVCSPVSPHELMSNAGFANRNDDCSSASLVGLREMMLACGQQQLQQQKPQLGTETRLYSDTFGFGLTDKYNTMNNTVRKTNNLSSTNSEISWIDVALNTMRLVDKFLDTSSESILSHTSYANAVNYSPSTSENSSFTEQRAIFVEFVSKLTLGLYFADFDQMVQLPNPFQIFDLLRDQVSHALFPHPEPNSAPPQSPSSNNNNNTKWLNNVIFGSLLNCLENSCKLMWLLRMVNGLGKPKFDSYLAGVKVDMTLIWTTLQTSEIQLDSMFGSSASNSFDGSNGNSYVGFGNCSTGVPVSMMANDSELIEMSSTLSIAKSLQQSLEILHLKLCDFKLSSSNPLVPFYIDQIITSMQHASDLEIQQQQLHSQLQNQNSTDSDIQEPRLSAQLSSSTNYQLTISKIHPLRLIPLFITATATTSKSPAQREFIKKQLVQLGHLSLDIGGFVGELIKLFENCWLVDSGDKDDDMNESRFFDCLVSRGSGFNALFRRC
ncbi:unnamed protein product [Ambrosiozyma monospora]|uniref:Unnamed protein product n=1 Tax=Ambrosiozyma monospora TaxID=43982 RepID=A0A9W6YVP0_AMBMO|nr:unnamed protein product [Ambrosiozyma monospora]